MKTFADDIDRLDLDSRRVDLDWVRIGVFFVLILYHTGMAYVSWGFHVKSFHAASVSDYVEPLMFLTSPWRLSLLFFVSGVATAHFIERTAMRSVFGSRTVRLLIPLAFSMLVIVPPQAYVEVVQKTGYEGSFFSFWGRYLLGDETFCAEGKCLAMPSWNHMWFVAYLWCYTMVCLALNYVVPQRSIEQRASMLPISTWLVVPIVLFASARILLVSNFPSTHDLTTDWYNHAQYFLAFCLGLFLAKSQSFWTSVYRLRWFSVALWLPSYLFLAWYFGGFDDTNPPSATLRYVQRVVWAINQWSGIAAILGLAAALAFRGRLRDSKLRRYLTDAVFPYYIVHQTAIVVAVFLLTPLRLPFLGELALVILITGLSCAVTYEIATRAGVFRPLFGLRISASKRGLAVTATPLPRHSKNVTSPHF